MVYRVFIKKEDNQLKYVYGFTAGSFAGTFIIDDLGDAYSLYSKCQSPYYHNPVSSTWAIVPKSRVLLYKVKYEISEKKEIQKSKAQGTPSYAESKLIPLRWQCIINHKENQMREDFWSSVEWAWHQITGHPKKYDKINQLLDSMKLEKPPNELYLDTPAMIKLQIENPYEWALFWAGYGIETGYSSDFLELRIHQMEDWRRLYFSLQERFGYSIGNLLFASLNQVALPLQTTKQ